MTSAQAQEHCPDCGRAVEVGADLCSCGFPLMFLRQEEPERAVLKPGRRPAEDDDTDELPVVQAPLLSPSPEPAAPVPPEPPPPDGLVCASCDEVNPFSRTWCAQCGAALRVRIAAPEPASAPPPRPRRRALLVGAAAAVVLLSAAGIGVWAWGGQAAPDPLDVGPLSLGGVTASATAEPGEDNAENPVTYLGDHVRDGNPATAWRVDGDGVGAELVLPLDGERTVTEVALIPGYAKTDPVRRKGQISDRFLHNGRVTRVRWEFDGGEVHVQTIASPTRGWARSPLPEPVTTTRVRLVVEQTQAGTRRPPTTAISEVQIVGR